MLGGILASLAPAFVGQFLDKATGLFELYLKKEITREQLNEKLLEVALSTFADVEKAYADSINRTFASFMEAAAKSKLMQAVWASVALSQLIVLLWHQLGIPAIVAMGWVEKYPPSGTTTDWAYALVMFCLGGGAIALKSGPGSGSLKDQIKSLMGK